MASPTTDGLADLPRRPAYCPHPVKALLATCLILFGIGLHLYSINGPDYPHFEVHSAVITHLNASSSESITATWDLTLRVINPNRNYSITYKQLEVSVLDLDVDELPIITTIQLPLFSQPAKNTTSVPARLRGMLSENHSLTFRVQVFAWMRLAPKPKPLAGYEKTWGHCNVEFVLSGNNVATTPSYLCNYIY